MVRVKREKTLWLQKQKTTVDYLTNNIPPPLTHSEADGVVNKIDKYNTYITNSRFGTFTW
ncbi:hypothetical protein [Spiroplasma phage MaM-2019a]|uniref:Uncharacterized protein n=1 Tax=Spiroplasma poulsonii TaxID=2138 RepID=A0A2P6FFA6_9MOLU|nr:hypothetical protein SMSRO_SF029790 [Spiroplasma poulsonii]UXX42146.1 hypothetical protein [Spiroplasma phage MaM-2019a]PQM30101.1 hypothetical protein SMSRO_SF025730 [Spiroplasma poulsonii]PQM30126.1 hypothetical protein SMSRO_SF025980 [Spiroplasma poulsonii]PQM30151.1 hypothetical protein SMSRO_SF026230 [Spiroplasma poulsonii]